MTKTKSNLIVDVFFFFFWINWVIKHVTPHSLFLTSLVAGLQQVPGRLVRDPGEFGPGAAQPGPPQGAPVLLQPGQLGRRGLGLCHAVDQLRVLLAQTRLAEMFHHSQHLCSLSPGETHAPWFGCQRRYVCGIKERQKKQETEEWKGIRGEQ